MILCGPNEPSDEDMKVVNEFRELLQKKPRIIKAEVRDAFTGALISQHEMVGMNGICFDVPTETVRVSVNWENVERESDT